MSSKNLSKIITLLVFVVIVLTPLFYFKQGVFPFIVSKTAFFQSVVEVLVALWIVLAIRDPRFRPKWFGSIHHMHSHGRIRYALFACNELKKAPLLLALGVFTALLVLTSAFGVDPARSFWSTYERAFGVVTILHLAAFALVVSSVFSALPFKKLLYASVLTGVAVDIIAFWQLSDPNLLLNEPASNRPGATFGNPTFLAGYALFNFFICIYLALDARGKDVSRARLATFFLVGASVLNIATIFIGQTRGDILALAVGMFALLLLFAVRPPASHARTLRAGSPGGGPGLLQTKAFYRGVAVALAAAAALFWFTRSSPVWSNVPGLQRFSAISSEDVSLQPRLIALRAAWQGFLERPFAGWGWENFNVVFNKHYDPFLLEVNYQETRFDKPHNFFMEYLTAGGIPLTMGFIVLAAFFILEAWRLRDRLWGQFLIAAFVAYVVHGLFAFETIGPALLFYLLLGLTAGARAEEGAHEPFDVTSLDKTRDKQGKPHAEHAAWVPAWAAWGAFFVSLVAVYYFNVRTVQASYYEFLAFHDFVAGRVAAGIEHFKLSIKDWSPYRWNFARDYAAKVVETYFYQPYLIPEKEVVLSIQAMEWVRDKHPEDAFNHYMLVDLYNQASSIDLEAYLVAAEREAEIALALSPNRQQVYFSLAKTKFLKGERELALQIVKDTIALNPRVADGHFYYGLLAFATNDLATGYAEIHETLRLGRQWKNFYEPRTVADYFGDAGYLDEAIELYRVALRMEPGDVETETKLGVAYFLLGDNALAREHLGVAAKKFDFTKSPAYGQLKPILDTLGI